MQHKNYQPYEDQSGVQSKVYSTQISVQHQAQPHQISEKQICEPPEPPELTKSCTSAPPTPQFNYNDSLHRIIQRTESLPMQPAIVEPAATPNYNYPMKLTCSCCKKTVATVVNQQIGKITYLWCALICCVNPLCCCIPFMLDGCLDKNHYCPNCGNHILRKHQRCFEFIGC